MNTNQKGFFPSNFFPSSTALMNKAFSITQTIGNGLIPTVHAEEPVQVSSVPLYSFLSAAVGISKKGKAASMEKILTHQSVYPTIAHSDQVFEKSAGEDSYFQSLFALGVGDGVGGWVKYKVDPSLISRSMSGGLLAIFQEKENALFNYLKNQPEADKSSGLLSYWRSNDQFIIKESPVELLTRVYTNILTSGAIRAGSTTFSMVMISDMQKGIMKTLNVGDSGFIIIRNGGIIYRSKPQQHRFNAPYQLTICPPERNGSCIQDQPKDGDAYEHQLADGDMVVMGTDGLFDNLFDWQILQVINQGLTLTSQEEFTKLTKEAAEGNMDAVNKLNEYLLLKARNIAVMARVVSISENQFTFTPFAEGYRQETGKVISGGKPDDITVIVGMALKRKLLLEMNKDQN